MIFYFLSTLFDLTLFRVFVMTGFRALTVFQPQVFTGFLPSNEFCS